MTKPEGPSARLWRELEHLLAPEVYARLRHDYLAWYRQRGVALRAPQRAPGMCIDCGERPAVRKRRCAMCEARDRGSR